MKKNYFLIVLALLSTFFVSAHDWTYRVTTSDSKEFFMWTPYVSNIRGVIFSTKPNYIIGLLGDSAIRRVCKEEKIAIVSYQANSLDPAVIWPLLQNGLKALSIQSGYPEVEFAPICSQGHSTEGLAAIRLAAYRPERFFGILMQNAIVGNDDMNSLNTRIGNVPLLSIRGSEERRVSNVGDFPWKATKTGVLWMRNSAEKANLIIQPGAGHFGWFPFTSQYTAKWLKQASKTMIPAGVYATTSAITLNTVNQSAGWLTECPDTLNATTLAAMIPYSYQAYVEAGKDPKNAFWHFNQEMAQNWIDIHRAEEAKLPITIRFNNSSYAVNNAWYNRINLNSYTQEIDINATTTPSGLALKYSSGWNAVNVINGKITGNACKYPIYGNTDWGLALFDGNAAYRVSEQAQWVKVNVGTSNAAFTFTDITNKEADTTPLAFGATYNSSPAKYEIISGAVKVNGTNLEIEPFASGTSKADICYCKDQFLSTPTDKFDITWKAGTWQNPSTGLKNLAVAKQDYSFDFYPNPSTSNVSLEFSGKYSGKIQMDIIDLTGRSLFRSNEEKDSDIFLKKYDISSLNSGVYLIQVKYGENKLVKRLIKQ